MKRNNQKRIVNIIKTIDDLSKNDKLKKFTNNITKATVAVGASNVIINNVFEHMKRKCIYKLHIDCPFCFVSKFIQEYFRNIPDIVSYKTSIHNEDIEITYDGFIETYLTYEDTFIDYASIKGVPVKLILKNINCGRSENVSFVKSIELETLKINGYPEKLKSLISYAIRKAEKENKIENSKEIIFTGHQRKRCTEYTERNFNNVFIETYVLDTLKKSLDKFVQANDWYIEHNIPYHFGILLYGEPGMGKTSIAQAIGNYMNSRLFILSGDDILNISNTMSQADCYSITKGEYRIILVEDIDCGFKSYELFDRTETNVDEIDRVHRTVTTGDKKENNTGLASVLNTIDGIGAPQNVIYIFTTNHIEKLDPALIRPGRIDLKLEIKSVNTEIFTKFMKHHYGENINIPYDIKIKQHISCAELQVKVMEGYSVDEMIDFVSDGGEM